MYMDKDGMLVGRVEIPRDGWFHDTAMGILFRGVDKEVLKYPLGYDIPHKGHTHENKSWTTNNFKPKV